MHQQPKKRTIGTEGVAWKLISTDMVLNCNIVVNCMNVDFSLGVAKTDVVGFIPFNCS